MEVTNKTILRNLKARLEKSKGEWAEDLPNMLWAYHAMSRIPTGKMLYSMVYGAESIILVHIGIPVEFRVKCKRLTVSLKKYGVLELWYE